jgi:hypothetical protein
MPAWRRNPAESRLKKKLCLCRRNENETGEESLGSSLSAKMAHLEAKKKKRYRRQLATRHASGSSQENTNQLA